MTFFISVSLSLLQRADLLKFSILFYLNYLFPHLEKLSLHLDNFDEAFSHRLSVIYTFGHVTSLQTDFNIIIFKYVSLLHF